MTLPQCTQDLILWTYALDGMRASEFLRFPSRLQLLALVFWPGTSGMRKVTCSNESQEVPAGSVQERRGQNAAMNVPHGLHTSSCLVASSVCVLFVCIFAGSGCLLRVAVSLLLSFFLLACIIPIMPAMSSWKTMIVAWATTSNKRPNKLTYFIIQTTMNRFILPE